jgi:hypothetical protein
MDDTTTPDDDRGVRVTVDEAQSGSTKRDYPRASKQTPSPSLPPVTGHPSEFVDRAADTASVTEHRERPLRVFAIDPSRGRGPLNVVTIRIPFEEKLQPGPIGRLIAVIDEDWGPEIQSGDRSAPVGTYPGVDLNAPEVLLAGGLEPSEMDLQSHQQMVYAVAMRTVGAFERALGRQVSWPWASPAGDRIEDRLRIYPHAGEIMNAFYDPTGGGSLLFGYFRRQLPSGAGPSAEIVYTALSYDVIAHEVVHPIIQAVAPRAKGMQSTAFIEGFADIIAMLQHFDFHDLVVDVITRTGGRIHERELAADYESATNLSLDSSSSDREGPSILADLRQSNPLFEIGRQFGEAAGIGGAIRVGVMGKPDPAALATTTEPHARGAILSAAVFDAFVTIYAKRTADLRRIGGLERDTVVSQDLALRLAAEAAKTAQHFQTICIRALDAWPTVDFQLGDYLRALITSDSDAVPNDEFGYREALIAGFRARGILPDGVTSMTEDGLRWPTPRTPPSRRRRQPADEAARLPDIDRTARQPDRRNLKTFAFDPSSGTAAGNRLTLSVPYELLGPGPVGRHVAVIDYDASNDRYYTSVNLETPELIERGGLDPSDIDPLFHQQMVYAVSMSTIDRFETALGRSIRWPWAGTKTTGTLGDRLRIYPHAMQEPNAYYDRRLRGLLFGYFAASDVEPGRNLPGQIVYTCLSADIVAHETTHALLDSVQPFFLERTGPDAPAFHEAIADIISLLGHFSYPDALLDTIQRTGGLIQRELLNPDATPTEGAGRVAAERSQRNPLVDLALQFGESLGNRAALRSALGRVPNPAYFRTALEPHERGAILVAAIFDAFFSVYLRRIADLLRIGRGSGAITATGDIHPDLAKRLAREATDTAARVSSIAARALDFCPPVDIEFGDYLRGLVTADYERAPDDPLGFRAAFIEGFRARGIYPTTAWSMTEEALRWDQVLDGPQVDGLVSGRLTPDTNRQNAIRLREFGMQEGNRLGLDPELPIDVKAIQTSTSHQLDRSGESRAEFKVHLVQRRKEPLDPDDERSPTFTFRGGCTVVLDDSGKLKYIISKRIGNEERLRKQRAYLRDDAAAAPAAAYRGPILPRASLASLHRGI